MKILVVDDERAIRNSLKEILTDEGYEVDTAEDGAAAAKIFAEDFPSYVLYQEPGSAKNSTVISLTDPAGRKALVVELISRRSSPDKVRSNCKAQGIPYLRFYYDYSENGWWNVRSYVVARVSKALGLQ